MNARHDSNDGDVDQLFKELGLRSRIPPSANASVALIVIVASMSMGMLYLYAAFISKLLPETGIFMLDWIKQDTYFCYLIPLALPTSYVFIYVNWLAMRVFENNE